MRGSVESGVTEVVHGADVPAELQCELHRFERFVVGAGTLADHPDADAGGSHERGRAIGGGKPRVGAAGREKAHHLDVRRMCGG